MAGQKISRRQKDISRMMRDRKNTAKEKLSVLKKAKDTFRNPKGECKQKKQAGIEKS